jgi:hypothetical protein
LLWGWETSPVTVDDNIISQFHFSVINSAQTNYLGLLFPLTEFGAGARTYLFLAVECASTTFIPRINIYLQVFYSK